MKQISIAWDCDKCGITGGSLFTPGEDAVVIYQRIRDYHMRATQALCKAKDSEIHLRLTLEDVEELIKKVGDYDRA